MKFPNSTLSNSSSTMCSNEVWLIFPTTYLVLYVLGLSFSLIVFCVGSLLARNKSLMKCNKHIANFRRLKQFARTLRSGDTLLSQVLISAVLLCNLVYMFLAIQRAYHSGIRCFYSLAEVVDIAVEIAITPLLIIFFAIRLLSSDNIVLFWIKMHTIVDVVTLPNTFIFLYLGQDWLVTKTLRFIWLTQLLEVFRFLPFIRSQDTIEAIGIMVRLLALWLGATGFIHMLETMGDPWKNFSNKESTTFLEYAYFTIVTLSTVGYGDISATTDIGRAFMTFFIIAGIAFFAFALPSLVDIAIDFYHRTQWRKFDMTRVPRHILVCGHITHVTVSDFLKDFLHKDRGDRKTHVLLMHTARPDTNLRKILHLYYTRVQYTIGSALNAKDLTKAKIHECWAVYILARKHCDFPEREDQENLLRLVSIKNTACNIPVTIQVLLSSSKEKVGYIPHTNIDSVICLSELKLGLLAQNTLCPGFSTLVSNLFNASEALPKMEGWRRLYSQGVSREIYITHFSHAFDGMSFFETAQICYETLGLILLAVEDKESRKFYISPSSVAHPHLKMRVANLEHPESIMLGYFIGEDQDHVNRVSFYRERIEQMKDIGTFPLLKSKNSSLIKRRSSMYLTLPRGGLVKSPLLHTTAASTDQNLHLNYPRPMEDCITKQLLSNHILLCVVADGSSSALNLRNFLEPLRRKTKSREDIVPVTIVANKEYLEKEWSNISCFPEVALAFGNPLDWTTLSLAGVETCRVCVILTAFKGEEHEEASIRDKGAILCSLMIRNHFKRMDSAANPPFIILDLNEKSNVQFLDFESEYADGHVHITQPFACGEVLASSFFDSITSSTFHSPGNIFLLEQFISGAKNEHCSTMSSIHLVPLSEFHFHETMCTFKQLYTSMLMQQKTVVAISRLLISPLESSHHENNSAQRFIVTAPPPDTQLDPSDHILILEEVFHQ